MFGEGEQDSPPRLICLNRSGSLARDLTGRGNPIQFMEP